MTRTATRTSHVVTVPASDPRGAFEALIAAAAVAALRGDRVVWASRMHRDVRLAFERLATVLDPHIARTRRAVGTEAIELAEGGAIVFVAANANGHRGMTADVWISHELEHFADELLTETATVVGGVIVRSAAGVPE